MMELGKMLYRFSFVSQILLIAFGLVAMNWMKVPPDWYVPAFILSFSLGLVGVVFVILDPEVE